MQSHKWQWFNSYGDNYVFTVEHENKEPSKIIVDNLGTVDTYEGVNCLDELKNDDSEAYYEIVDMLGTDPLWLDDPFNGEGCDEWRASYLLNM